MSSNSSASEFSSDEEFIAPTTMTHAVYIQEIEDNDPYKEVKKTLDTYRQQQLVQDCCINETLSILQLSTPFPKYETFTSVLEHINSHEIASDNIDEQENDITNPHLYLRKVVYEEFSKWFPLTENMHREWIATIPNSETMTKGIMYGKAQTDYLSVSLAVEYIEYLQEHNELTKRITDQALDTIAWHFTEGHNIFRICRESGLYSFEEIYIKQLKRPLQQNELACSEFKSWASFQSSALQEEADKAVRNYRKHIKPLEEKLNVFEDELNHNASVDVWIRYRQSLSEMKVNLSMQKCLIERAIAVNCLNSQLWHERLQLCNNNISEQLNVCDRAVRNISFDSFAWIERLQVFELYVQKEKLEFSPFTLRQLLEARLFPANAVENQMLEHTHAVHVLLSYLEVIHRYIHTQHHSTYKIITLNAALKWAKKVLSVQYAAYPEDICYIYDFEATLYFYQCLKLTGQKDLQDEIYTKWASLWDSILSYSQFSSQFDWWYKYYVQLKVLSYLLLSEQEAIVRIRQQIFESGLAKLTSQKNTERTRLLQCWLTFEQEQGLDISEFHRVKNLVRQDKLQYLIVPSISNNKEKKRKRNENEHVQTQPAVENIKRKVKTSRKTTTNKTDITKSEIYTARLNWSRIEKLGRSEREKIRRVAASSGTSLDVVTEEMLHSVLTSHIIRVTPSRVCILRDRYGVQKDYALLEFSSRDDIQRVLQPDFPLLLKEQLILQEDNTNANGNVCSKLQFTIKESKVTLEDVLRQQQQQHELNKIKHNGYAIQNSRKDGSHKHKAPDAGTHQKKRITLPDTNASHKVSNADTDSKISTLFVPRVLKKPKTNDDFRQLMK